MSTSSFDPSVFLDATTTTADERRPPLPIENPDDPNGLYTAMIGDISVASGTIEKGDKVGQLWMSYVIALTVEVPSNLREAYGPTLRLTDRLFMDMTPQNTIDESKGRNRGRRAYREATGTNVAGQPFSMRMLTGKVVKLKLSHEEYQGNFIERIASVLAA
jgi:hypothetical protein